METAAAEDENEEERASRGMLLLLIASPAPLGEEANTPSSALPTLPALPARVESVSSFVDKSTR